MAEAFGLAASGIAVVQVAMVVGKSVIALRNLWNEVRDVPDSITHLMQQVDIMSISLGAMEQNLLAVQAIENCEDIVGPALEYARRARDEFVALVDELSREINAARKRKRVVARLKVVLGQNQLARCESRLRGAVQLLGFAQQTSAFALSARLPDLIAARIMPIIEKRDENSVLVLEDANGTYEDDDPDQFDTEPGISSAVKGHRDSTRDDTYSLELFAKSNPKSVYEVQVRAPAWLTRKVWEFGLSRATSGWQALIRTYNIIEPNSEVIVTLLSEVNPSKVIGLFETGLASPLDVDCDGYSILDYAIFRHLDVSFLKYLYSLGARPHKGWLFCKCAEQYDPSRYRLALAFGYGGQTPCRPEPFHCCALLLTTATTEVFDAALELVGADYFYSIPLRVRAAYGFHLHRLHAPRSYRTLSRYAETRASCGDRPSSAPNSRAKVAAFRYTEPNYTTAAGCGHYCHLACHGHGVWREAWLRWGRDAAKSQLLDEEGIWMRGGTALLCHALRNSQCPGFFSKERETLWNIIQTHWLPVVESCGIGMAEYLERIEDFYYTEENFRPAPPDIFREYDDHAFLFGPVDHPGFEPSLTGLTYDPATQWLKYAQEFWHMVEGTGEKTTRDLRSQELGLMRNSYLICPTWSQMYVTPTTP